MSVHDTIKEKLNYLSQQIEEEFKADCLLFHGQLFDARLPVLGKIINDLNCLDERKERILIILQSLGGVAEATEKFVEIIRHFYKEVYFVVPRYAMSAGTIFCMSGDKIIMDYESSLGPIDPQIFNGKDWVPAQGYLDFYENLVDKSQKGTISPGELQKLLLTDPADLSRYEQAKNLTVTLLKKWLVQYKFKDWVCHRTNPDKLHQDVTLKEKEDRATFIADKLGDNKHWHSHGRYLSANTLKEELKLEIDNYPSQKIKNAILEYNDMAENHMNSQGITNFFHTRLFF